MAGVSLALGLLALCMAPVPAQAKLNDPYANSSTSPDVAVPAIGKDVTAKTVEGFRGGKARRVEHYRNGKLVDVTHYYRSGRPQYVMAYGPGWDIARVTTYFDSGKPHQCFTFKKGVPHGNLTTFNEDGARLSTLPYVNGKPNGKELRFSPKGHLVATSVWRAGRREGPFITWYPTKPPKRESQIQYTAGVPAGKGSAWYPSGNLKAVFTLMSGLKHGDETRYADDSKRKVNATFRYRYGLLHGLSHTYWEPGRKRTEVTYVRGKANGMERHWHFNKRISFEVKRLMDTREGTARMWDEQGRLLAMLTYRAGMLHGNEFRFYERSGAVRAVFVWKDGKLQGMARVWRDGGKINGYGTLLSLIPLQNGQIHGTETRYYEDGKSVWMKVDRVRGVVSGKVTVYRKDGTRERITSYKDGKQHGRTVVFGLKGKQVIGEYNFADGQPAGIARRWYANGRAQSEWPWAAKGSGVERRWHPNGELQWTVPVSNGLRQGVQTVYAAKRWKWAERSWDSGVMTGEEKRFYANGKVLGIYTVADGKWNGPAKIYAKRGGWLWSKQPYEDGLLHGTEVRYARNGSKFALYFWKHGKRVGRRFLQRRGRGSGGKRMPDGRIVYFYPGTQTMRREIRPTANKNVKMEVLYWRNGAKRVEAPLHKGKRHGEAAFYKDDGQLHARVTFANGVREGSEVRYYATGEKRMEIPFKANKAHGYVRSYYRDGTVESRYPAGTRPTGIEIQYHQNGAVRMTVPLVKGDRHGYARVQGPYGKSAARLSYKKGERHGVEVHYHDNGKPRMVVPVVRGQRTGRAVIYTREGRRWSEMPYQRGQRHGTERRFGPSGKHIIEERDYNSGRPVERRSYVTQIRGAEPPPQPTK
ncbi:MAG: hypothetical protein KC502_12975 [Myxococcales bacterium]|nr:hypothetical protein [Myxococcales bacterium]